MANPETSGSSGFLAGVIEGFYGPPWAPAERLELFDWMSAWGLNTYFYCPKDDWKQRAIWREPYSTTEAQALADMIRACRDRQLHFLYALSPGLDIRYGSDTDRTALMRRFEQMLGLGATHFALLFDDIPDRLDADDLARWGSLASAQAHLANDVFRWTRSRQSGARFLFCPTPYCGRMATAQLGGAGYLATLGRELSPEIDILWTGPEIISREITVAHVEEVATLLRRPPMIWDNLHANDYDGRRFYCGPYTGRPAGLREAVRGILTNPNCEFPLNYVPIRTLAAFVNHQGTWNPRESHLSALRAWFPSFATCGEPLHFDDLVLLADCYYLPHEDGPEATALFELIRGLLARPPAAWGQDAASFRQQAARLRDTCARMAELRNRPLFYALSRRIWELREEMDLLEKYVARHAVDRGKDEPGGVDFHLPGTYRGGLVARLQQLLEHRPNGEFVPAAPTPKHIG